MSEFEELFQSIQNSVTVDVVRDSAIVLVNEGDAEHPLKAGEYYFDDEKNILYVGGYVPEKFYFWQFIKGLLEAILPQNSPAPRHRTDLTVLTPTPSINTVIVAKQAPRITTYLITSVPTITYNTSVRKANVFTLNISLNYSLPTINHNSLVG